MAKKKYKNRDWLYEKYVEKELTNIEIADICDVSDATICRWKDKLDIPTRDGTPERVREKISESVSEYHEEHGHPFEGKSHSEESKKKISEAKSGKNHQFYGESRPEFAEKMKGEKNPSWKGGTTSEMDFRKQTKWKNFSFELKEEADWTCENCGAHGSDAEIQTHHAHPVSDGGEKFDNVFIVLCKDCHGNKSSFWHNSTVGEQIAKIGGEPTSIV
jgi:hypothetical protein